MYKGFNESEFIGWLSNEFIVNRFAIDLVQNIIEYAHKHEHVSKDMFCQFVADMIPEVEMLEVARFCDSEILTDSTIKQLGRAK